MAKDTSSVCIARRMRSGHVRSSARPCDRRRSRGCATHGGQTRSVGPVRAVQGAVRAQLNGVTKGICGHVRASTRVASYLAGLSTHSVGRVIEDLASVQAKPTCTVVEGSQPKHQVAPVLAVVGSQDPDQSPVDKARRLLAKCGCCEIPHGPSFGQCPNLQIENSFARAGGSDLGKLIDDERPAGGVQVDQGNLPNGAWLGRSRTLLSCAPSHVSYYVSRAVRRQGPYKAHLHDQAFATRGPTRRRRLGSSPGRPRQLQGEGIDDGHRRRQT
jgi:hypothetical protein